MAFNYLKPTILVHLDQSGTIYEVILRIVSNTPGIAVAVCTP
jgi:hypothetical protein